MADRLDEMIRDAEKDIHSQTIVMNNKRKREKSPLPRVSIAFIIWLSLTLFIALEFETFVLIVSGPAESKIEADLGSVLTAAGNTVRNYRINNGHLPALLPNPAIRGLVHYEQRGDSNFTLRATVNDVTMVLESSKLHPYRAPNDE